MEFGSSTARATPSQSTLAALPGVRDARREGDAWALATSEVHLAVPALLDDAAHARRGAVAPDDAQRDARGRVRLAHREAPARCLIAATRHPALVELTLARLREFVREPEAVFWVFVFPILMTCALGVAFRSRGDQASVVGIVDGPGRCRDRGRADRRAGGIDGQHAAARRSGSRAAAIRRAAGGRTGHAADLPVRSRRGPKAGSRAAPSTRRCSARPAAAIRFTARDQPVETVGLALRRLARARPARHEHHEHGPVGHRLLDRHRPDAEAAQAARRVADAPRDYLLAQLFGRLVFLVVEVGALAWRSAARLRRADARLVADARRRPASSARLSFGGIGLLVASRARTVEAVSGLLNLVMLPMWLLSGRVLRLVQLPERDAAVHPRAAADRAQRRAPRRHARRERTLRPAIGGLAPVLALGGSVSFPAALGSSGGASAISRITGWRTVSEEIQNYGRYADVPA